MAASSDQLIRPPAVAGMFYPAEPDQCRAAAVQLLNAGQRAIAGMAMPAQSPAVGALVPHAGWICSGAIAAEAIVAAAARRPQPDVVVVFGAIHSPIPVEKSVLDTHGQWSLPGGPSQIATEMRRPLAEQEKFFLVDDRFHASEHAVEVELPLIQLAWPTAQILPIEVPPNEHAVAIGQILAERIKRAGLSAVYLASSDLTHYGPNYRFVPAGIGKAALDWALENDKQILQIITELSPQRVVPEVAKHFNACGAGAIAAMLAACQAEGASGAKIIRHSNSYATLTPVAPQAPINAVGYAAVIVG